MRVSLSPQAWADNKVPLVPPGGEMPKERKVEPQKADGKKKSQAEMEQEMLQYSNPMMMEVDTRLLPRRFKMSDSLF